MLLTHMPLNKDPHPPHKHVHNFFLFRAAVQKLKNNPGTKTKLRITMKKLLVIQLKMQRIHYKGNSFKTKIQSPENWRQPDAHLK